jgi:transcriptional regulator with XRE-family HTH domain
MDYSPDSDVRPNQRLKRFRESQGYSQTELAGLLGCDPSFIGKVESGVRRFSAFAFALEDLTADWEEGPIRARDWVTAPIRKAS